LKAIIVLFISLPLFVGCQARPAHLKPVLVEKGEVFLYLQPFAQEAEGLRFAIEGISALRDDGTEVPLSLFLDELKGAKLVGVQKLLASGILPPGLYKEISLKVGNASVRGEEGEAALLVSEAPVTIAHEFHVRRGEALVLLMSFSPSKSISDSVRFTPVFHIAVPGRELTSLTGYVTNSDANIISVFNKRTMQIFGAIATGRGPEGVALDEGRKRAYVAASREDAVEVIDVVTGERMSRIGLNLGDAPRGLALTPDGRILVSVNYGSNTASVIDPLSLFELKRIRVGEGPHSVVVDRLGLRAYIINSLSNTLSVVDLPRRELAATIAVEETPLRGAFNRRGDRLYVISRDSPNLTVIDPSSLAILERIFVGTGAVSVKVDTRTDLIFVGKRVGGEILVIDPFSSVVIDRIDVGGTAAFMTIDGEQNTLLVVLPDRRAVQMVNLVSKRVMAQSEVLEGAYAVAVMGER
jgi:YVTN family beta-propeller protein